jgi:Uncharacterized conserved protein
MRTTIKRWTAIALLLGCLCFPIREKQLYASDGEEYITITVDAEDDNDNIMYSLDSSEPEAFTNSNQFTIPAGTSHTIYVRDAAGNITSQEYTPSGNDTDNSNIEISSDTIVTDSAESQDTQDITIDLEIENKKDYSDYEYLTDSPAEPGSGTLHNKVKTDGSDDSDKVFYTVKTAEGDVFYMVIDQNQSADNVYLLNTVTREDLKALASDDGEDSDTKQEKEDNLLTALTSPDNNIENTNTTSNVKSGSNRINMLIMLALIAAAGGIYYYLKVYKHKKDEAMDIMEAMDINDFEQEESEDDEEVKFETDDEEKQEYLDRLINEDEELYDADPDTYFPDLDEHEKENEQDMEEDMIFPDEASPVADFDAEYDEELDGEEMED